MMNAALVAAIVLACILVAVLLGRRLGRRLPANHLEADTRDTVKLATGLVATMAALLLGLLVSSAKGAHDTRRNQVIQIAAKISFLDRILASQKVEAADARAKLRAAIEEMVQEIWLPSRERLALDAGDSRTGAAAYMAVEGLSLPPELQGLKARALTLLIEIGELRSLLVAQSVPSISLPMLIVMVCWLAVIFFSFSLLAPLNATASLALLVSALSVSGAIFLVLEMDQPFKGTIQVSSQPIIAALAHIPK